jgi:hypothetical protein
VQSRQLKNAAGVRCSDQHYGKQRGGVAQSLCLQGVADAGVVDIDTHNNLFTFEVEGRLRDSVASAMMGAFFAPPIEPSVALPW